jgi:hypothetical protein
METYFRYFVNVCIMLNPVSKLAPPYWYATQNPGITNLGAKEDAKKNKK